MPAPLLEVSSLHVAFASPSGDQPAVRGVSFTIAPAETLALVGESGSGKSVTSLAIMRLLPTNARITGSIRFNGSDLLTLPEPAIRKIRGSGISMIFQEPMTALNPVMPIGQQVAEAVLAHHPEISRAAARDRALQTLAAVALPNPELRFRDAPYQFSGGQRQRIMLAIALANRPALLIADEPTTALDVTVQAQILDLLTRLRREFNLSVLFISHDLAVVSQIADRVAIMRHGQVLETGPRDTIFRAPQNPYTRALLAAAPSMHTDKSQPLATVK
jgi:peptide/nickel transport system ATP-binding protein